MIDLNLGIKKGKILKDASEIEYYYLHEHYSRLPRGTVFIKDRIIYGYPHIKRIFVLEKGIKRNIKSKTIFIEEKIDGFNLRITNIDGNIYAFSRGGHLDLFSSEKVQKMPEIVKFLIDNYEYVLCAEMIGNTPYTSPTKKFDVKLFVFDIMRTDGSLLPVEEKYNLLDAYLINQVPRLGEFSLSNLKKICAVALSAHKRSAEGIVLRGEGGEIFKHVNSNSDIADIEECAIHYFDMPSGFFHQRILRSIFFAKEFDLTEKEISQKIGNAFFKALSSSIGNAKQEKSSFDEFEILISKETIWQDIKSKMGKEVLIEEISRKKEGSNIRIRFKKIYRKTSKLLHHYLSGSAIED